MNLISILISIFGILYKICGGSQAEDFVESKVEASLMMSQSHNHEYTQPHETLSPFAAEGSYFLY